MMVKKLIFNILVFISFVTTINGQNNKALLEISYRMEITNDTVNKVTTPLDFVLLCNRENSVYFSPEAKEYYNKTRNRKGYYFIKPPKSKGSVYKTSNSITVSLPIEHYLYTYHEPNLNWVIINASKKKILNYEAVLAKTRTDTGQVFYAWFSPDINISDGPFRFKGLPGLVLEVYNQSKLIHIYITALKKSEAIIEPINYSESYKVEKSAFLKKRREYIENPQSFDSGLIIRNNDDTRRKALDVNPNTLLD